MTSQLTNTEQVKRLRQEGKHQEARDLLMTLVNAHPDDAMLQYEAACVHDFLGMEAEAVPFYVAALSGDLVAATRRSALVGLGSTYRTLGRFEDAERTLLIARAEFPEAAEVQVFLAMTRHNLGHSKEAVEALLRLLARTSRDESILAYSRAIDFYAADIDRTWP
ncbi:MAG: hypothetical protein EAZ30_15080 [Betaproteobacteria bacterium]|nr:MAG: hypothetical protein EAZ30_15080 [Betaproteobacteria bacterium]